MVEYIKFLPVAQLDSASDSAFRHRRNIAMRGDGSFPRTNRLNYHNTLPEWQTLKVLTEESQNLFSLLPVAQLDSASDSDSEGRRFKSFRVGQKTTSRGLSFFICNDIIVKRRTSIRFIGAYSERSSYRFTYPRRKLLLFL